MPPTERDNLFKAVQDPFRGRVPDRAVVDDMIAGANAVHTPHLDFEELDLSKADRHDHPEIEAASTGAYYLALVNGRFWLGQFTRQHYGWNFECGFGVSGLQFDAPGWNHSRWERLWRMRYA